MRFLVDASCDARIVAHLIALGHDATRIGRDHPGDLPDLAVLAIAHGERRVLVTDDRDFGELIFRQRLPHAGVIYLRLDPTNLALRLARLEAALDAHPREKACFLVVGLQDIRVADTG